MGSFIDIGLRKVYDEWAESDLDHRAVSSGDRLEWEADGVCGRVGGEGVFVEDGGPNLLT